MSKRRRRHNPLNAIVNAIPTPVPMVPNPVPNPVPTPVVPEPIAQPAQPEPSPIPEPTPIVLEDRPQTVAARRLDLEDVMLAWRGASSVDEVFNRLESKRELTASLREIFPNAEESDLRKQAKDAVRQKMTQLRTGLLNKMAKARGVKLDNRNGMDLLEAELDKQLPFFGAKVERKAIKWDWMLKELKLAK